MADKFQFNEQTYTLFVKSDKKYQPYPGGLGKFYFDRLKELSSNEELIAQIDAESGAMQNFKQLLESSIKLAQYMRDHGIKAGDNITMCSYNHMNTTIVAIAAQFIGAVLSCTDPIICLADTVYLLKMIQPKMVFISNNAENLMQNVIETNGLQTKIITITLLFHKKYQTLDSILKESNIEDDFEPVYITDQHTTCNILFSSGTTGMPKGICLSHDYFFYATVDIPKTELKWVLLNYATLYWISSLYKLIISVQCASARLLCKQFVKEKHWDIVAKYQVTYMIMSNTIAIEASKFLTADTAQKITNLKHMICGGGPIPEQYMSSYSDLLPNTHVVRNYALTEAGLVAQSERKDPIGSSGKPSAPNQTIKIVDPDSGENLALNKVGEIRIKRQCQMVGYYKMDSSDAWDAQGFLKTGDLGYLDDEFNLFVIDRIKEMFKYRSWHVVPAKIERVLCSHPDVLYAVVFGKPTYDEDENHAMAIVCLHSESRATPDDLETFANQQMDEINKIRAGVTIVEKSQFLFTPTGKINRRLLKKTFL